MTEFRASTRGNYFLFVVSVDDLEWTKHWLSSRRCDQLIIFVGKRSTVSPGIMIRAVESKAASAVEPIGLNADRDPFLEAVDQVVSTLDALWALVAPDAEHSLVEDLRFASFIEHIAAVALADLHPLSTDDLEALWALQIDLPTLAAATIGVGGPARRSRRRNAISGRCSREAASTRVRGSLRNWCVHLVRAGTDDLATLLGTSGGALDFPGYAADCHEVERGADATVGGPAELAVAATGEESNATPGSHRSLARRTVGWPGGWFTCWN